MKMGRLTSFVDGAPVDDDDGATGTAAPSSPLIFFDEDDDDADPAACFFSPFRFFLLPLSSLDSSRAAFWVMLAWSSSRSRAIKFEYWLALFRSRSSCCCCCNRV